MIGVQKNKIRLHSMSAFVADFEYRDDTVFRKFVAELPVSGEIAGQ